MFPGDIIEICPTKQIDKSALYSKDMRDIVFEVERNENEIKGKQISNEQILKNQKNPLYNIS